MADKERIGWVGLGKMGAPMAKNILKADYPVTVYNRTREKTKELAALGARVADSPRTLASEVDAVISMIFDDKALEAVSTGPDGVLKGANSGLIFIDMSTVSTVASARIAEAAEEKGVHYLRAPVIGGVIHAETGDLRILASGPKEIFDRCKDILAAMSKTSSYLGSREESRIMKLVLNMQVGIIAAMTAEALTFGEAGGMNWNQMIDIVADSIVSTPMIQFKAQYLKDRKFLPAFTVNQMIKDFDLVLDTGKATNAPMPIASVVRQLLGYMKAQGKGNIDFWQILTLLEGLAGLKVCS
jgi:3-hydroxyisobutyrate dehydrogenase-like beta-hydroxyacid dehydrogenase